MIRKSDISTPEGYFPALQERLEKIAAPAAPVSTLRKFSPYFAYAASLALAVVLGGALLRKTAVPQEEEGGSTWQYLAYLSQSMDPDGMWQEESTVQLTEEDIVNYLIDNGTSVDYLNTIHYEEVY